MGNLRHAICICRDARLWKSKMWRLSLFALPPPPPHPRISMTNLPLTLSLTLPISGNCLGHHMKSYMRYRPSQFTSMMIFVSDEIDAKMPQKQNYESTKIRILSKNRIFRIIAQKSSYSVTQFYLLLVTCTGDWEISVVSGRVGMYVFFLVKQ